MHLLHEAIPKLSLVKILTTPEPPELRDMAKNASARGSSVYEALKQRKKLVLLKKHLTEVAEPVVDVMLHQRDRYMLWQLRSQCPRGKIIAVVGMAHMDGIETLWKDTRKRAIDGGN
mmetsp:Transcript_22401/g.68237  ORF Transcript_22401/g.68237 Transcript_22401/m.68237 type:complete len:117 (+) Transcript_22401:704-1054(+)